MISICIPIFNYDVRPLTTELLKVANRGLVPVDIILIDDGSAQEFQKLNKQTIDNKVKYIELKENTGRAAVRNSFLRYSQQPWFLFLDCDTIFDSNKNSDFLSKYINALAQNRDAKIIVGGRLYSGSKPPAKQRLRWKYGTSKECRNATERTKKNAALMGNNFLIEHSLLEKYPFDETLKKYGHEDTLLGITLQKAGYEILHIDNPVENGNLETNKEFVQKAENAIDNLLAIEKNTGNDGFLKKQVKLLAYRDQLKRNKMTKWVLLAYRIFGPISKKILIRGFANLHLFNFYKIGYLLDKEKK